MKKMVRNGKLLVTVMFAFVLTFVFGTNVNATPNTVTVSQSGHTQNFIGNTDIAMPMLVTQDGTSVYCMDIDKKFLEGQTASYIGDGDAGLLYILQNGYPHRSYKNNNEMDAYITQMAIWWYVAEDKLSNDFKNTTGEADRFNIVSSTKKLVAAARTAKDNQVKPSMSVNASDTTFKLSSDQKYYESAYISATVAGTNTYNVSVNDATKNTVVVDEQGNIGTTMNSNEKFMVKVPVAEVNNNMNISVKFTASGKLKKAKIYKPSDNKYQRVVGLFEEPVALAKNITLKLNSNKHVCEVVGDKYYGKNGTVVDKDTYTKDCKRSCEQDNGKYYGKDGREVDKRTYNVECGHVCEFTDNKYYGKDGKEVDKKTFNKECNKSCEQDNGKYYGKDGTEIDKKTFDKECGHFCEVVNNKYYGKNGNIVDKSTYNRECGQEVTVPNTSANIIFWTVGFGAIILMAGLGIIIYRGNKNKKKA